MSEQLEFINLVSQHNPATRQYRPANRGYPPQSSMSGQSPNLMDPFFDDEDELPDTVAFGRSAQSLHSQESGLTLTQNAVPPAGSGLSKMTLHGEGVPQGWAFDDDDLEVPGNRPFPGSGPPIPPDKTDIPRKKKWRWPWQKDEVLTGDRTPVGTLLEPGWAGMGSSFLARTSAGLVPSMVAYSATRGCASRDGATAKGSSSAGDEGKTMAELKPLRVVLAGLAEVGDVYMDWSMEVSYKYSGWGSLYERLLGVVVAPPGLYGSIRALCVRETLV